jgi:type IV pilus assembly protein PilF
MKKNFDAHSKVIVFQKIFLGLLIFIFSGCSTGLQKKERAELHIKVANGHLTSGNIPAAMSALKSAKELDENNPEIENATGIAFFLRGRHTEAETQFRKAIRIRPNFTEAKNNLARVYIETGKFLKAEQLLKEVSQDMTFSSPERGYLNLALLSFKKNEFSKSMSWLDKALEVAPNFCAAKAQYGLALYQSKQYKKAIDRFDDVLGDCGHKFDESHFMSAMAYAQLGDLDRARSRFKEVISFYPNSIFATKSKSILEDQKVE